MLCDPWAIPLSVSQITGGQSRIDLDGRPSSVRLDQKIDADPAPRYSREGGQYVRRESLQVLEVDAGNRTMTTDIPPSRLAVFPEWLESLLKGPQNTDVVSHQSREACGEPRNPRLYDPCIPENTELTPTPCVLGDASKILEPLLADATGAVPAFENPAFGTRFGRLNLRKFGQ
jgi:hypothetical protein